MLVLLYLNKSVCVDVMIETHGNHFTEQNTDLIMPLNNPWAQYKNELCLSLAMNRDNLCGNKGYVIDIYHSKGVTL